MTVWVALLRGVNVGGNHILPMKDFAKSLERAGFESVRTYIQSGNVVFRSSAANPNTLADRISETVNENFGFKPSVFVLKSNELKSIVGKNPYPSAVEQPKSLHIFLLASAPKASDISSLQEFKLPTESFELVGKVLYLHAPEGIGRSKLAASVGKALRADVTARNWRTVGKLLELANEIG